MLEGWASPVTCLFLLWRVFNMPIQYFPVVVEYTLTYVALSAIAVLQLFHQLRSIQVARLLLVINSKLHSHYRHVPGVCSQYLLPRLLP